jgi:hypothetical protein
MKEGIGMEWISIKDKLPDKPGEYWVYGKSGITSTQWNSITSIKYWNFGEVTHWAIPEPPK